jgi:YVTN family beta-propeller protein
VIRVDPTTGAVTARIALPKAAWTAASTDAVWISTTGGKLVRIDPSSSQVAATIQVAGSSVGLGDPDVVNGRVWVPVVLQNRVAIVDPAANAVAASVRVGRGPFTVTAIRGQAWIPSWHGSDIWRLSG